MEPTDNVAAYFNVLEEVAARRAETGMMPPRIPAHLGWRMDRASMLALDAGFFNQLRGRSRHPT